ncbi:MAG TPA: hypothetical protein VKA63_11940 [Candidatus Krumholzibacteria bacterium]|nr:hypothetical protein [Candidatus Krumholzibacteria bacterium]
MKLSRARRILLIMSFAAAACLAACGHRAEQPKRAPLQELHWPPVEGAGSYRVRAWSGYRLLFAEDSWDTLLALTPNMQRVLVGCDSLTLEVKALDAANLPLPGGHRRYEFEGSPKGR